MLKKRWYVLVGFAALIIFVGSAANTTWLTESVVSQVLGARPGVVVKRVHIDQQKFSLPGRMQFEKIDLVLEVNGKLLMIEAPGAVVTGLQTFWTVDRRILFTVENMLVRYDLGKAKDVKADLTVDRDGISGPLTAVAGNWDKLQMKNASAFLIVNASGIELRALKCDAYGGKITGKVLVNTSPAKNTGTYAAELFIEAIDMVRLADINPEIAVQLNGSVTGTVKLEGDLSSLRTVDTDLNMPSGGKMSASLLAALTQYFPQSREKKQLDILIRKGGKVALEAFSFTMKGGEAGKFAGEVRLKSREINLELNLAHDINTDGTIDSLLGYWGKFLQ
jgi:hypothetical protein